MTDVQRGSQVRQVAWDQDAVRLRAAMTVGHVALRRLGQEMELKRLFVEVARRGCGIARVLLTAAQQAARDLGAQRVILQTGDRQPEAVAAYQRAGYTPIPVFPPYVELLFSLCFEKRLPTSTRTSGAEASPPGYLPSPPGVRTG